MVAGEIQLEGGLVRKAELTCCVWLLGASGLYSRGSPMSCAHRRGFSLPRTHCHSCVGTGTQPWVLPYKTRCCYRAICFGDQDVVVLVPSPVQSRWNCVAVGAGSSSSRCSWWVIFFHLCLVALRVRWTTEEESWLLISAHLQGSCVSGCFISASFGGLMPQ